MNKWPEDSRGCVVPTRRLGPKAKRQNCLCNNTNKDQLPWVVPASPCPPGRWLVDCGQVLLFSVPSFLAYKVGLTIVSDLG
jgi:hypothetical protein